MSSARLWGHCKTSETTLHFVPRCNPSYSVETHRDNLFLGFEHSTLSSCLELREFELESGTDFPNNEELKCILAIKSMEIKKIIVRCHGLKTDRLTRLDRILAASAERLGPNRRLEVEFRYSEKVMNRCGGKEITVHGWERAQMYLPKFGRKGRVRIWDLQDKLFHCSETAQMVESPGNLM